MSKGKAKNIIDYKRREELGFDIEKKLKKIRGEINDGLRKTSTAQKMAVAHIMEDYQMHLTLRLV